MKKRKVIKIKKGDTVKVVKSELHSYANYIGKTGTVYDVPTKTNGLDYVHVHFKGMADNCFEPHCLKVIKKQKKPQKSFKFVISSTPFNSLKEAENKIKQWSDNGDLESDCRVYKVIETYKPELKLIKVKE